LGISADAVRSRIKRDTLRTVREGGRVFVVLGGADRAQPTNRPGATDQPTEGYTPGPQEDRTGELVDLLRAQLEDLRTDRDAWRDQARRSDYLASTAMDRTRELEGRLRELEPGGSTEATEAPETVEQEPRAESRSSTAGAQEATGRPWWRRFFREG
jgi:hypothetical protein